MELCRQILEKHWEDYKKHHFNFDEEWDKEQRAEYDLLAETALKTFISLFGSKPALASRSAAENSLATQFREGRGNLLASMTAWCEQYFGPLLQPDGAAVLIVPATTTKELQDRVRCFLSSSTKAGESSFWPLIKEVQVGCPASRTLNYVTFVDLPGNHFVRANQPGHVQSNSLQVSQIPTRYEVVLPQRPSATVKLFGMWSI